MVLEPPYLRHLSTSATTLTACVELLEVFLYGSTTIRDFFLFFFGCFSCLFLPHFRPISQPPSEPSLPSLSNTINPFLEPLLPFLACFLRLVPSLLPFRPSLPPLLPPFRPHKPVQHVPSKNGTARHQNPPHQANSIFSHAVFASFHSSRSLAGRIASVCRSRVVRLVVLATER